MSDGYCEVAFGGDYDDENTFYVETWRKARKPHVCGECRKPVAVGSRYQRVVGKSDGAVWTAILCEPCHEILHEFAEGSWTFGRLRENFDDAWGGGAHLQPCLNRLTTAAAKAKLVELFLAFKGIQP